MKRHLAAIAILLCAPAAAQGSGLAGLAQKVQEFGTLQGMAEYCGIPNADGEKLAQLVQTVVDGVSTGADREALFRFYEQGMYAGVEAAHKGTGGITCPMVLQEIGKITSQL